MAGAQKGAKLSSSQKRSEAEQEALIIRELPTDDVDSLPKGGHRPGTATKGAIQRACILAGALGYQNFGHQLAPGMASHIWEQVRDQFAKVPKAKLKILPQHRGLTPLPRTDSKKVDKLFAT